MCAEMLLALRVSALDEFSNLSVKSCALITGATLRVFGLLTLKESIGSLAGPFSGIKCAVGLLKKLVCIFSVVWQKGDAYAGTDA